jgi:hypothetical protein
LGKRNKKVSRHTLQSDNADQGKGMHAWYDDVSVALLATKIKANACMTMMLALQPIRTSSSCNNTDVPGHPGSGVW